MLAVREFINKYSNREKALDHLKTKEFKVPQRLFKEALLRVHKTSPEDTNRYRGISDEFKKGKISYL